MLCLEFFLKKVGEVGKPRLSGSNLGSAVVMVLDGGLEGFPGVTCFRSLTF